MSPIVKNILAVVAGIIAGIIVNGGLIYISGSIIPPPSGVDPNDMESIKANIHLYETKHFIMPFLAHALGTLVAAFVAVKIAANRHVTLAMVIGVFFLFGGIMAVRMVGGPMWFQALDLLVAYLPMAFLGAKLGGH